MKHPPTFQKALASGEIWNIRGIPKADLHNHCLLGIPLDRLSTLLGEPIQPFRHRGNGIADINDWIKQHYLPLIGIPDAFPRLVAESFRQLVRDGVTVAEMSLDAGVGQFMNMTPAEIVETLQRVHRQVAPEVVFRPCLGFARILPPQTMQQLMEPFLELDYFTAVDLYDDELSQPVERFREVYRMARAHGLRCTAHAGEFGTAEDVRTAVEVLELDAVQHGIAAASSPEVMRWLADHEIVLQVCPTSNIMLGRTTGYKTHPIRILFDHGVKVTVNTDDVTLFGQGVSEEFQHLYNDSLFGADELELIRMQGLSA